MTEQHTTCVPTNQPRSWLAYRAQHESTPFENQEWSITDHSAIVVSKGITTQSTIMSSISLHYYCIETTETRKQLWLWSICMYG